MSMDCIQDQRHIYGGKTLAQVHAKWLQIIDGLNEARLERSLDPIFLSDTGIKVPAYVNHGRWVAACVCGGGMGVWQENPVCACMDCGRLYGVEWPEDDAIVEAERLLLARPNMTARNWTPWQESICHLAFENESLR